MLFGGSRNAMEMIRCPSARRFPVRKKKRHAGPAPNYQWCTSEAINVSVSRIGSYALLRTKPVYCPRITSLGLIGTMLRNTLFFSSLIGAGSNAVGGSIAMNPRI